MYKKLLISTLILYGTLQQCATANELQSAYGWHNRPSFQLLLRFKETVSYTQIMNYTTNTLELQIENTSLNKQSEQILIVSLDTLQKAGLITEHYFTEAEEACILGLTFATTRNAAPNRLVAGVRAENNTLIVDFMPSDFFSTRSNRTKAATATQNNYSWRIMIDPGHGGRDPGAIATDNTYEKTLALDIAQRVTNKLKAKKITALMTRSDDTFISLANRSKLASSTNADLFVSIHLNASGWPMLLSSGIESYSLRKPKLLASGLMRDYIFINQDYNTTLIEFAEQTLLKTIEKSQQLTTTLQHNLCSATTTPSYVPKNRGAKTETFRVLLLNNMPSTLIEAGFLSNNDELKVLQQPEHRNRIAEGIVQGIEQYISEHHRKKTVDRKK